MACQVLLTIRRKCRFRLCWAVQLTIVLGALCWLFVVYDIMSDNYIRSLTISDIHNQTSIQKPNIYRHTTPPTTTTTSESRRNKTNDDKHDDESTTQTPTARSFSLGDTLAEIDYYRNKSIVCHAIKCGRLGNTLFEYASVVGIARATGKIPVITNPEALPNFLKNPPPVSRAWQQNLELRRQMVSRCNKARRVNDGRNGGTYHENLNALEPGQDYHVEGCLQSWKYFSGFFDEVREAVTFSDKIVWKATHVLEDLRTRSPNDTFVGVHVRRGDVAKYDIYGKDGWVLATPRYFRRAMTYFRDLLGDRVTFVVVSQDVDWFSTNIAASQKDVVLLQLSSPEVDMQILSMMDHLIQSLGSYSWWSAFKIPGKPKIVYFKDWTKKNSKLDRWFSVSDYMLPEWLPM